jgi:hypothetical protein
MTALNSEKQTKKSLGTLLELILKVLAGLISAVIVPSVVLFLLVTLMSIFSALYEQQGIKGTALLHNIGISFAVAFFVSAYTIPAAIICVGSLGFPIILIGWRLGLIRWWTCVVVGFFLSSFPGGLFLWNTYSKTTSSANGIVPTSAGWIQFANLVLIMGLLGAIGGFSFWLVWRWLSRLESPKQSDTEINSINLLE